MPEINFKKFVNDQPQYLRPKLRLFLSADLTNSTALKQKKHSTENESGGGLNRAIWVKTIASFFQNFHLEFQRSWQAACIKLEETDDAAKNGTNRVFGRPMGMS